MDAARSRPWVRTALVLGVAYFLIGWGFALPADHAHAWRLAAWAASGVVYAAHIGYERFGLRNSPRVLAAHAALAVAIGAFGLAVAGMIHSSSAGASIQANWWLALVLWPAITAVPALLVALLAGALLVRLPRSADAPSRGRARPDGVRPDRVRPEQEE